MRFPLVAAVLLFIGAILLVLFDDDPDRHASPVRQQPASAGETPPPSGVGESSGPDAPSSAVAPDIDEGPAVSSMPKGVDSGDLFRGTVRIRGAVVGPGGAVVGDARILIRPLGFYPHQQQHFEALGTRTDDSGRFALDTAPPATHYEVYAVSPSGGVAKLYVPQESATTGSLSLKVAPVVYERYLLFDSDGRAIPVRDYGIGTALGADDLRDSIRPPDPLLDELLGDLGWNADPRAANEMFTIYFDDGSRWEEVNLRIPGFHDQEVRVVKRRLAEWPAATRITLERNTGDSRVLHRISFPELHDVRSGGALPDLHLQVRIDGVGNTTVVGRRCPCVWAPKGSEFEIRQTGFDPLGYSTTKEGDAILIEPHYPEFGYLELGRESSGSVDQLGRPWSFTLLGHFPSLRGRTIDGRHAVIGPLPVGTYTVLASSFQDGKSVQSKIGPVVIAGGRNAYTWR